MNNKNIYFHKFVYFLLMLFSIAGCSKNRDPVPVEFLQDRNGVYYLPNQQKPFTGYAFMTYFGKAQIEYSLQFANGIYDGQFVEFYENGMVKYKGQYEKGQPIGTWTNYDNTGQISFEIHIKEGVNNYSLVKFENNKKSNETNFRNGKTNGQVLAWNNNEIIIAKGSHSEGFLEGAYELYHDDGTSFISGQYSQGKLIGKWKITDKSGLVEESIYDKDGKYVSGKYDFTKDFYKEGPNILKLENVSDISHKVRWPNKK